MTRLARLPHGGKPGTSPGSPPDKPPGQPGRRHANLFIALCLAFHLLVPLSYYARTDRYDERFAWRMFSAVRMRTCDPRAWVERADGRQRFLDLGAMVHPAWQTHLRRNRIAVVRSFLRHACSSRFATRVVLENRCWSTGGAPLPPLRYARDCAAGVTAEPEALQ